MGCVEIGTLPVGAALGVELPVGDEVEVCHWHGEAVLVRVPVVVCVGDCDILGVRVWDCDTSRVDSASMSGPAKH